MIVSDKRCPTACIYSTCSQVGVPVAVTKYHLQRSNGLAQAIIVNSGTANVFLDDGERLVGEVCSYVERKMNISVDETVIASTGKIGGRLDIKNFEYGVDLMMEKLTASPEGSLLAARAIMTTDSYPKQVSYSFELGDYVCKMGGIFKGNVHVGPNMATTLIFLTTDVNVTPTALQRALSAAAKDSVNLLSIDGEGSPNDTVCIMANGKAGNYVIDEEDSEYQKFVYALRSVLFEICRKIAADSKEEEKVLLCTVKGVHSKQLARSLALAVIRAHGVKTSFSKGIPNAESIIYTLLGIGVQEEIENVSVEVVSQYGRLALFEGGMPISYGIEHAQTVLSANEIELSITFIKGNYTATAIGCF